MEKTSIKVSLRIMGDNYSIQNITNRLGIYPSESWNKGDYIRDSKRKRTYTAWIYNIDAIETLDINVPIKKFERLFLLKTKEISKLKKEYNLDISIDFVIIIENEEPPAIYFEEQFIKFASEIGARFDIDTYIN